MRAFLTFLLAVLLPVTVAAQITVPNTFTTRQVISSSKMNQNFDEIELKALNRAAPIFQATVTVDTNNLYDIGQAGARFRDFFLSRNALIGGTLGVTGATTLSSTLSVTGTTTFTGAVSLPTLVPLYFDGGSDTFIRQVVDNELQFATEATERLRITNTAMTATGTLAWGGGSAISSSSNVALLNATNTFTAGGTHTFTAAVAGGNGVFVTNTLSGVANFATFRATAGTTTSQLVSYSQGYTTGSYDVQAGLLLSNDGAGGISIAAANAAGDIRFYSGSGTLQFQIDDAGNWRKGANIMDSTGTPTVASGFGGSASIEGTDYAFRVITGGTPSSSGVVNFGRTWTNAPVCVVSATNNLGGTPSVNPSTTQLSLAYANHVAGPIYLVLCRGY
jgi:hypothetical protein